MRCQLLSVVRNVLRHVMLFGVSLTATAQAADVFDLFDPAPQSFIDTSTWTSGSLPTDQDRVFINETEMPGDNVFLDSAFTVQNLTLGQTFGKEGRLELRSNTVLSLLGAATGTARVTMVGEAGIGRLHS